MSALPPGGPAAKNWFMTDLLLMGLTALLTVAAAVTIVHQWQHRQACAQVARDLANAAAAFQAYGRQNGAVPPDALPGEVPEGMTSFLDTGRWTEPTPAGGNYRWTSTPSEPGSATATQLGQISVTAFSPSPPLTLQTTDLLEIDRRIDDGDLGTGAFRLGFNGWPVLSVRRPRT